jgi:putative protein-disulfide isomerase
MPGENNNLLTIEIFTDPLCCWSWAFEPQLQQLKVILNGQATWLYRMGGLIPSWENFHDNVNAVSRPMQMGPVWMHAGQIASKPINHHIWIKDPPASSYPACIAVKCATLQSAALGEEMLYLLREACMTNGENIAKQEVIFVIAARLTSINKSFNLDLFKDDYLNDNAIESFRADLMQVSYYRINRFPALIIKSPHSKPIMISGYKHYREILNAIEVSLDDQNAK